MSTENKYGSNDYRDLKVCQRVMDYFLEARRQMEEAERYCGFLPASIYCNITSAIGEIDEGIESLKSRIASIEKRLYGLE